MGCSLPARDGIPHELVGYVLTVRGRVELHRDKPRPVVQRNRRLRIQLVESRMITVS
jgi:hypothetical protein